MPSKRSKLPAEFFSQVQTACRHYDKPKRIADLPLARVALRAALGRDPRHPTGQEGRVGALRAAIDASLATLKRGDVYAKNRAADVYVSLHCYVYGRDPFNRAEIALIERYLDSRYAIPRTTYFSRRKEGLEQLGDQLSAYLARHTTWLEPVPVRPGFVGREKELATYRKRLVRRNLAVIEGVAGIGKTALAAQIAAKAERPVCWLTVRPGLNDSLTAVLYTWAAFLARQGQPHLWALMNATASEAGAPPDLAPRLQAGLSKIRPLLCLDDVESFPATDKAFWSTLDMIRENPHTKLLLVSRRRPALSRLGDYSPLSGLSPAEAQGMLRERGLELTLSQAQTVAAYTDGNPRLLELWAAYVRRRSPDADVKTSLAQLSRISTAVARYLTDEILTALNDGQVRAARLLSLSRQPLDGFILRHSSDTLPLADLDIAVDDLDVLHAQGVIQETPGERWALLPILSDYLRQAKTPSSDETTLFQQWLSRYYAVQGNVLEAAFHAAQGGEAQRAVLLLDEQEHRLIEQGHTPAMLKILNDVKADQVSEEGRQIWRELRGELWRLLGDYDAAEAEARAASREASTALAQARAERTRGTIAKLRGHVWQATDHYRQAQRFLARQQATEEVWLHRDLAWSLMEQNDLDEAWDEAQRAQIALENTLGVIARRRGDLDQALIHYERAAAVAREVGERRQLARVINNLAVLYRRQGQLDRAVASFQENLPIIKEIGERVGQAITHHNLGICYDQLGEREKAIHHVSEALKLFQALQDAKGCVLSRTSLAEIHLGAGQLDKAREHAEAAIQVEAGSIPPADYAEAQRMYAEVLLAQGHSTSALTVAREALVELEKSEPAEPSQVAEMRKTLARIQAAGEVA